MALPGGPKPETNKKPKDPNREKVPAQPGDIVLVKSEDFVAGQTPGHSSSAGKTHPAVVIQHDENHIVHVAPIGHTHPGGGPTIPALPLGISDTDPIRPGLIAVGTPKQIHQDNVWPLGVPRKGNAPMSPKMDADHFNTLQEHLAANKPPAEEPPAKEKGKKKEKQKRSLQRRRLEARRNWRY